MPHSPVLRVRVNRGDLAAIDELVRADGVPRSDVARRLLRVGLAAAGSPTARDAFEPLPPLDDWQDAVARLEHEYADRWWLEPFDDEQG